ncbi:transposable element Tcb1 transposase [Trichonephila clavipes]|nr:transposable element Tcb1 transposase [Trichonephila clavipes]
METRDYIYPVTATSHEIQEVIGWIHEISVRKLPELPRVYFDQVSKFDRGKKVIYKDCGLSFREISQRVGRNQATVMRIYHRWMQEETTNRWGRSHPPRCTTARDDRRIVRMAVMNHAGISRTLAQQIKSVMHHLGSARAIRRQPLPHGVITITDLSAFFLLIDLWPR